MKTNSWLSTVYENYAFVFEYAFMRKIFDESKKCRMHEDDKGLMLNTARALVEDNREDFDKYLNENTRRVYFQLRQHDYENIAKELVEYIKDNYVFKRIIEEKLCNYRAEIFNEKYYKTDFTIFLVEEHPMQTFVYWLDCIDNSKNSGDDLNCFNVKRQLTNLLRVGNATLRRSEWQDKIIRIPNYYAESCTLPVVI